VKLIDGKSVLLGMGLGIIITSVLGVIFFLGYKPHLSDREIIEMGRKLGMVDKFESSNDFTRNSDGSLVFTIHENESFTEVSKRLFEAGIIDSSIEFEIMLKKDGHEKSIKPGQYTVSFEDDLKEIIQMITGGS
jgi:hypothetical protein